MNISPFVISIWVFFCTLLLTRPIVNDNGDFSAFSYSCGAKQAFKDSMKWFCNVALICRKFGKSEISKSILNYASSSFCCVAVLV